MVAATNYPGRFEKFSEGCRRALSYAQEDARSRKKTITPESILIGILRDLEALSHRILTKLEIDVLKLVRSINFARSKSASYSEQGDIGLTRSPMS